MSDKAPSDAVKKLRDMILSERGKGNIVFQALPGQFAVASLDEFIKQPAEGMLYDLNRSEEISLTFLKDPKWVNDFAVALVIRKLASELTLSQARVGELEKVLRKIAKPALGGKQQQWIAQEALKEKA